MTEGKKLGEKIGEKERGEKVGEGGRGGEVSHNLDLP